MTGLSKDDLAQMNRDYFQSLEKERLVEVADNLHRLAVEQWEKINSNSRNSSQPPSRDNPFQKPDSSSRTEAKPYMGHHVLELETTESGLQVVCQLHHYYQSSCSCGHQSQAKPGVGITSKIEGRNRDLKLTEYVLVGSHLSSLIASLGVRYRLS